MEYSEFMRHLEAVHHNLESLRASGADSSLGKSLMRVALNKEHSDKDRGIRDVGALVTQVTELRALIKRMFEAGKLDKYIEAAKQAAEEKQ
jgi:hypothetical protein